LGQYWKTLCPNHGGKKWSPSSASSNGSGGDGIFHPKFHPLFFLKKTFNNFLKKGGKMSQIERPKIYQEGLPTFLTLDQAGLLIIKESFVKEGGIGSYHLVIDFGHSRDGLRKPVPQNERITANTRKDLVYLCFENSVIAEKMALITQLANDPTKNYENQEDRQEYRNNLGIVYQVLAEEVRKRIGGQNALIFPPKNGGIFVKEVYEQAGFPYGSSFFDYRMSRILGEDGRLMVGVKFGEKNPKITDARVFVFADDCLASDISAWGTLEYIKQELVKGNIFPSEARVIIAVAAATQRGLESLLSPQAKDYFGFGSLEAIAGIPVYQMTENFYLQHPDGRYVVGDMGKWTRP
jgi:hypothetical protein